MLLWEQMKDFIGNHMVWVLSPAGMEDLLAFRPQTLTPAAHPFNRGPLVAFEVCQNPGPFWLCGPVKAGSVDVRSVGSLYYLVIHGRWRFVSASVPVFQPNLLHPDLCLRPPWLFPILICISTINGLFSHSFFSFNISADCRWTSICD